METATPDGRIALPDWKAVAYTQAMSVARFQAAEAAAARPLDRSREKPNATPLSLERRTALRNALLAETPSWYVPWVLLFVPSPFGIAAVLLALSLVHDLHPAELPTVSAVYLLANAFAWWIHGAALHRRHPLAPVLYGQHTPKHLYLTDDTAIRDTHEYRLVLIAGYGLMMIFVGQLAVSSGLWWLGFHHFACCCVATAIAYAVRYEWLHFSYHLPHEHPVARNPIIQRLARHHAIPHVMQRWNVNVTYRSPTTSWGPRSMRPHADRVRAVIGALALVLASASSAVAAGAGSCIGNVACSNDTGKIGKKACLGEEVCAQNTGKIGDGSCIESGACVFNAGKIGKGSCIGILACNNSDATIGNGSCTANVACSESVAKIGNGACTTSQACNSTQGTIGNAACGGGIGACERSIGEVKNGACLGGNACQDNVGAIGKAACLGEASCQKNTGAIGNGACVGTFACIVNTATIGAQSCRGSSACENNTGQVGKASCLGASACENNTGTIADGACLGQNACLNNTQSRAAGECIGVAACAAPP
jgi:hypothetical protein